ncbi:uncharacterized protein V1516DRAFT_674715 [Lipomyces oligophaga]|uniref:uncharacterized protein n=1 Tax=Lipomyces oligophaga TaxID=45792 RepID=UPI0034CDD78D
MSSQRKRANLCVPFIPLPLKAPDDISSMLATTLPMVAMFLRNKLIAWASLLVTLQSWLNENESNDEESSGGSPGWLKVVMSLAGLLVCYLDLFVPAGNIVGTFSSSSNDAVITTRLSMAPRASAT